MRRFRAWLARSLDPELRAAPGLSLLNRGIIGLIALSILIATLETEPAVTAGRELWFRVIEWIFVGLFSLEYLARLWSAPENPRHRSRWHFARSPTALLDLATILVIALTASGATGALLRLARVLRVLRLTRLGRFTRAAQLVGTALHRRRYELSISAIFAALLILISASMLYLAEGASQPDAFGSIPRAMWWSIATLTTVGYGDVYPITPMGRILASITAIAGIGMVALPAGIVAAALSDVIQRARADDTDQQ